MKHIVRRIVASKPLWVAAALLLAYSLIGFVLAPYLIERFLPRYAVENLGVQAAIGKVRVNPFLLKLEANDLRLEEAGRPLLAFNRLFVDLELAGVLRWTWTFGDVQLDGLQVNGEIARDGRFNLAELAERWHKRRPRLPNEKPPPAVVRRLQLRAATLTFTDFSLPEGASVRSDGINLEVTDLATIPDREGRYSVSAKLPRGGALSWHGELTLEPIASKGEWRVQDLQLATVWPFFRNALRVAEPGGVLSFAGHYDFSYANGAAAFALHGMHAKIAGLSLAHEKEQQPMLALDTIEASDARYDLAKHELVVPRLTLAKGSFAAALAADGTLDWQRLFREQPRQKTAETRGTSTPFHARAEAITIDNVALRYTDRTRAKPLDYSGAIDADLKLDIASAAEATRVIAEGSRLTLTNASVKAADSGETLVDLKSIAIEGGRLDTAARTAVIDTLAIKGVSTALTQTKEQQPMLALETIEASGAHYDLAKHELVVPRVALANGTFTAALAADGTLDWQRFFGEEPQQKTAEPRGASSPFHARAEAITIDNVALRYTDRTRAKPLDYSAAIRADLKLDIASGAEATRVMAEGARLSLTDASVKVAGSGEALVNLKSIRVEGGRLDTAARTVMIDALAIKGGSTAVTQTEDGRIALVDAFSPARPSDAPAATPEKASEPRWKYAVHAAEIYGLAVAFSDRTYKPAVRYDVEVAAALKRIASDAKSPFQLNAALRVAQGGTIDCSGTVAQDFTQADLKLDAAGIGAEPLRPVLARYTTLELKSGSASVAARFDYRSGGKPALRVEGNARILNLLVNEADTGDRFLSWKTLTAEDIALSLSPNRLTVKDIHIEEPGAKIVITKDHSVNLTRVVKPAKPTMDAGVRQHDDRLNQASETQSERFPVRVARIRLQQGTLDFADNSLVLPFATRVNAIGGAVVGLFSYPQSRAELKLDGLIDPNGSARAEGSLKPANPTSFLDINVKFENVEMPPLSPYTATFAGRKIAAGRLWVDVQYKIVDSQLLGENKVVLADFELGERVQAPNALDLPLDLAIALLKEPDGRIHLAVPVRGDVDNPKFEYGALIRDVIATTLRRIVTAPFRFIAGLFGGRGNEDLQSVAFDPGAARLMPPMREQLQKVAQALKERRQLKLVVHGAYDRERDGRALRDQEVRRTILQALGVKLQPGEDPGPIAFGEPGTQRALEKLLSARAGVDAVDRFAAEYAKTTGKEVRRVNPVLAMIRRGRGDRAFYEALFERSVQIEPLPETVLEDLAAQRARAIADFIAKAGIDPGRVTLGKSQTVEDRSKPPAATLSLEAA